MKEDQTNELSYENAEKDAREKKPLSKYIKSKDKRTRAFVAYRGYGFSDSDWLTLSKDRNGRVRSYVARRGMFLDKFLTDRYSDVRYYVAKFGYGLETLINDESCVVRRMVAYKLVEQENYQLLNQMIDDSDYRVRDIVAESLASQGKIDLLKEMLTNKNNEANSWRVEQIMKECGIEVHEKTKKQWPCDYCKNNPSEEVCEKCKQAREWLDKVAKELNEALSMEFGITTNCEINDTFPFPQTFSKEDEPVQFDCCLPQNPILNLFNSFDLYVTGHIIIDEQNQFSIVDGEIEAIVEDSEGNDIFTFGKATYTEEYGWQFEDTAIHFY